MAAPAQPQQKKTLLMTEGSIWKSILLFSVPLILGNQVGGPSGLRKTT